jgi:hypothetical protein
MDITLALGIAVGITAVCLVVCLWVDYRRWRARQRAAAAAWVLAGIEACEKHAAERQKTEASGEGERDGES